MPVAEFTFPPKTYVDRKRNVAHVLWCLHLDGPFEDKGGAATAMLLDALRARRVILSQQVALTILGKLDHPGAAYAHLVRREKGGKRTFYLGLIASPHEVPFPKNPWPNDPKATFQPRNEPEPVAAETEEPDELGGETFTRQALRQGARNGSGRDILDRLRAANDSIKPEPEPEPEPVAEPEEQAQDEVDADELAAVMARRAAPRSDVAPAPTPAPAPATENGLVPVDRLTTVALPDDLIDLKILDPISNPDGFAAKLTTAITLITGAITDQAAQQANAGRDPGDIARLVDERMSAYVRLVDENQALKGKLATSLQREADLIALARQLKASLEHLHRSQG